MGPGYQEYDIPGKHSSIFSPAQGSFVQFSELEADESKDEVLGQLPRMPYISIKCCIVYVLLNLSIILLLLDGSLAYWYSLHTCSMVKSNVHVQNLQWNLVDC